MEAAKIPNQGDMATKAGVSRETVNNILNGKVIPDEETLVKLAGACRVNTPSIVFDESGPGPISVKDWILEAEHCLQEAKDRLDDAATAPPELEERRRRAGQAGELAAGAVTAGKGKGAKRRVKGKAG